MTTDLSVAALLAAAEAFLARGNSIQYDQRSMDRVVQITPRRDKLAPPEAATEQHMLFLDCSSFVNAVYHAAFGRVLDADLTWHMAQMSGAAGATARAAAARGVRRRSAAGSAARLPRCSAPATCW